MAPHLAEWAGGVTAAVRRALSLGNGSRLAGRVTAGDRYRRDRRSGKQQRRFAEVRRLAAAGLEPTEIACQTRLSHDTVALLLELVPVDAAVSAGDGTFFRILNSRTPARDDA